MVYLICLDSSNWINCDIMVEFTPYSTRDPGSILTTGALCAEFLISCAVLFYVLCKGSMFCEQRQASMLQVESMKFAASAPRGPMLAIQQKGLCIANLHWCRSIRSFSCSHCPAHPLAHCCWLHTDAWPVGRC